MSLMPPQDYRKTAYTHRFGLYADRPAATDVLPGTLYFSYDTLLLERSNGATWDTYTPAGITSPHAITHETGGSDPITLLAESVLSDDGILARLGDNETVTGIWEFTANRVVMEHNGSPTLRIIDSGGGTDEKRWYITNTAGTLIFRQVDDTGTVLATVTEWVKSGAYLLLRHNFGLALPEGASVSLTADQTAWSPSGLGTINNVTVSPTAPRTIRGIVAQPEGYILIIKSANTGPITFTHNDGAAAAADRMILPNSANISLTLHSSITLIYDSSFTSWRCIAKAL